VSHVDKPVDRPAPWRQFRAAAPFRVLVPFLFTEWVFQHLAYVLSRWSLLTVLEYAGSFSVLVAVVLYFAESGQRLQQKHYQAWQVINTAQGKGGNGGRIDALEQLNEDGIALTGVDLTDAFLQGVRLDKAELRRANMGSADMRGAQLRGAKLADANLIYANLRGADLREADLSGARLDHSDLTGANLAWANLAGATLNDADFTNANLADVKGWESAGALGGAILADARNAPPGLMQRAAALRADPAASRPATLREAGSPATGPASQASAP